MKRPYKLIMVCNGRQKDIFGHYHTENQGLKAMNALSEKSLNDVKFPIRNINNTKIEEAKFELVLLKRRDENDPLTNRVRNAYGEFVEHVTTDDEWLVIDKAPYEREETFWVYGYQPYSDRKDYKFIYEELVLPKATKKTDFLNMKLYLNKVIFQGQEQTDFVICKNKSDAIQLYNLIKKDLSSNKKIKHICFSGDCNSTPYARSKVIEELMKLTNWDKQKIVRPKTKTQNGSKSKKGGN